MGSQISIVNKSFCILNLSLNVLNVPFYSQDFVKPGDTITRNVGKVWFAIESYAWNGNEVVRGQGPDLYISTDGEHFTMLHDIGINGTHERLWVSTWPDAIPWDRLTEIETRLVTNDPYPFYQSSEGWYMGSNRNFEIRGGPNCVYKRIFIMKDNQKLERNIQLFDESIGLNDFYVVEV